MTTHTPGPWTAVFDELGGYDCMSAGWHIKAADLTITTINEADYPAKDANGFWTKDSATTAANARLIAAAPDLLEALMPMLHELESLNPFAGTLAEGYKAIAKASA